MSGAGVDNMSAVIEEMAALVGHAEKNDSCGGVDFHSKTEQVLNGGVRSTLELAVVDGVSVRSEPLTLEAVTIRRTNGANITSISTIIQCLINDQKVMARIVEAATNPDLGMDPELTLFLKMLFRGRVTILLQKMEEIGGVGQLGMINTQLMANLIRGPYGTFFEEEFDDTRNISGFGIQVTGYHKAPDDSVPVGIVKISTHQEMLAAIILGEVISEFRRLLLDNI